MDVQAELRRSIAARVQCIKEAESLECSLARLTVGRSVADRRAQTTDAAQGWGMV